MTTAQPQKRALVPILLSGFIALAFQSLVARQLRTVLGSSIDAFSVTLAAFLGAYAWGGHVVGQRTAVHRVTSSWFSSLHTCAAAGIVWSIGATWLVKCLYPAIYTWINFFFPLAVVVKFAFAAFIVLPAAFCLGGALPTIARLTIQGPRWYGRDITLLYATHALGGCLGVYLAGFYLPMVPGTRASLLLLVLFCLCAAGLARISLSGRKVTGDSARTIAVPEDERSRSIVSYIFLSGFAGLGLELLWTRMFTLVSDNSVYSLATVLVVMLASLTAGAFIAYTFVRRSRASHATLAIVASLAGIAVALTPLLFGVTTGLKPIDTSSSMIMHSIRLTGLVCAVILVPSVLLGMLFPFAVSLFKPVRHRSGHVLGRLIAVNTLGSICGCLIVGLLLLRLAGLWLSIAAMAGCYLAAALILQKQVTRSVILPALGVIVLVVTLFMAPPLVHLDEGAELVDLREGPEAVTAVVDDGEDLRMRVNNSYIVGSARAHPTAVWLAHQPLMLHPTPESVFVLGLGTGISAGATLSHPVKDVTVCELVPEMFELSRKHFKLGVDGLYDDDRVRLVSGDGRNVLWGEGKEYDVIISDLFVPWKAGAGGLYTVEHFRACLNHLKPNGLFAQWLPLYQAGEEQVGVIIRTMLDVFPQVTMWRGTTDTDQPLIAIVGQGKDARLSLETVAERLPALPLTGKGRGTLARFARAVWGMSREGALNPKPYLFYYAGNLTAASKLFAHYDVNSDEHPVIEFRAPMDRGKQLVGLELTAFQERVLKEMPPEYDPYLADIPEDQRRIVRVGLILSRVNALGRAGKLKAVAEEEAKLAELRQVLSE